MLCDKNCMSVACCTPSDLGRISWLYTDPQRFRSHKLIPKVRSS